MVGFSNITARVILYHLFLSYESNPVVDLEKNFDNMKKSWYPQQPVEITFNQIHDCVEFEESGGITIGEA